MLNIDSKKAGKSRIISLHINKYLYAVVIVGLIVSGLLYFKSSFVVPIERISDTSQLVMLGDLNDDKAWNAKDKEQLEKIITAPWSYSDFLLKKVDVNRNQIIDEEDVLMLSELSSGANPYQLNSDMLKLGRVFPKPREFFLYTFSGEYIQRPTFGLQNDVVGKGPLDYLSGVQSFGDNSPYLEKLLNEVYDEALRFSFIYDNRKDALSNEEKEFVGAQLAAVRQLYDSKDYYELLLHLILLSEAGETLSTKTQPEFVKNVRLLAGEFRNYLLTPQYKDFTEGNVSWQTVFSSLEGIIKKTTHQVISLETLGPSRDLTDVKNYIDRAEWQIYKSKVRDKDFHKLLSFAQNDRRYLRAVSNTTVKHSDLTLQNHNVPMMLLFRQAMAVMQNDKKSAVGLLDETIRIPFFWAKAIPDSLKPSSVALEHFLLPGNMEDGSDKSRHWNVFGGVSLYRSPEESLDLALRREVADVRTQNYSPEAMTEFIRDMIANCYGIYHVVSYDLL